MRKFSLTFIALLMACSVCYADAASADAVILKPPLSQELKDPVVLKGKPYIIDGDTLVLQKKRVRLFGIDAPELHQVCLDQKGAPWACGEVSKTYLIHEVLDKKKHLQVITCKATARDKYKRLVGVCYLDKKDLNESMVLSGNAIAYRHFSVVYAHQEDEARKAKRGIWRGSFEEPYLWRKKHKSDYISGYQ